MDYEWNNEKSESNQAKHGINFAAIEGFDWENATIFEDTRHAYAEPRFVAFGKIQGRLIAVVYTVRNENTRIISMRKANSREVKKYG